MALARRGVHVFFGSRPVQDGRARVPRHVVQPGLHDRILFPRVQTICDKVLEIDPCPALQRPAANHEDHGGAAHVREATKVIVQIGYCLEIHYKLHRRRRAPRRGAGRGGDAGMVAAGTSGAARRWRSSCCAAPCHGPPSARSSRCVSSHLR